MTKKFINGLVLIAMLGVLIFGVVDIAFAKRGGGGGGGGQLTPVEIEGLLFMREEEKLARDVYIYLYSLYGLTTFDNISQSEQNHMNAILNLLNYYGLPDPADPQPGVFNNQDLQQLYNDLIAWGDDNLNAALRVGGTIEEVDILDLEYYLANTNKSNIIQVYSNLLAGSENHLRAFVSRLYSIFGDIYVPLYLSQARYDEIIAGGSGGGGGGGGGGFQWGQP
jgi:hypothetical protein